MLVNEEVISAIRTVFPLAPLPEKLVDIVFETERPFEVAYIHQVFNAHSWEDIPRQVLIQSVSMLIYMTEDAYLYYLPAYLVLILDYDISDFASRCILDMFSKNSEHPQQKSIVSLLAVSQRQVLIKVFQYLREHDWEEELPEPSDLLYLA